MMQRKKREDPGSAVSALKLSEREARRLERAHNAQVKAEKKSPSVLRRWWEEIQESRAAAAFRPSPRGWNRRGGGYAGYIEAPPEYQGTSVQVCGLWPFIAGAANPVVGVPLGYHLRRGTIVCGDPISWFLNNLVLNPSGFVLGRPGLGKSSLIRRMIAVLDDWGVIPMVLGDTKPDYVDLIRALEGQVIQVARGRGHLNPLDLGPLVRDLARIDDPSRRHAALEEMRGRRVTIITGLLELQLDRRLQAHEASVLSETLRQLDPHLTEEIRVGDVYAYIASRPQTLQAIAMAQDSVHEYNARVRGLLDGLTALSASGPFGDLFSEPTSEHIIPGRPMVFDISGIDEADGRLSAAVQSVCWNYGSAVVSSEKHLAEADGRRPRHYMLVMDELWRMLRASDQMVYFLDALTRLNRQRGLGQIMCTHTMADLEMQTEHLTKIAWGFVERSAMVYLGGLAQKEMGNLEQVFALTGDEKSMLTDWSSESTVNPETNRAAAPPGRGNFLLKIGKKPGIPFRTHLTSVEQAVNDTNTAWKMADA